MKNFTCKTLFYFVFTIVSFTAKGQITSSFTADVTSGCAPLVVHFTNTSTGPVTGYYWDFGTGTTSVLKDASTSFTSPGTYIVKMTVYGPGGPITTTMTITVYPPPTVSFTASTTSACPGTPVTFTSTTVGGVPGTITYTWNFGDGGISTAITPTHVYTTSGYFNVTLTATNSMGCVASLTLAKYMYVFTPAVPDFSASPTSVCKAPGTTTFTNLTTGTPGFTYSWSFGDGTTSAVTNPSHTYSATGSYTVKITVTDGNGCTSVISKPAYISVGTISASFTPVSTSCVNNAVTFLNTSSPHVSSTWDFGDGGTGTGDPGSHYYTTVGTFTVRLIIFDGSCFDTITHPITILPGPAVTVTQVPSHPCPAPVSIALTAAAPPGTLIAWTFGDGGSGSGSPISHTYAWRGVYPITMMATDPVTGCTTGLARIDTIYDIVYYMSTTPGGREGCKPLTIRFSETTKTHEPDTTSPGPLPPYPFPIVAYSWVFGDGATSTGVSPSHTYTAVGIYEAVLTFVTSNGCTFMDSTQILVGDTTRMTATVLNTHVCYDKPITFVKKSVKGPIDEYVWEYNGAFKNDYDTTNDTVKYYFPPGYWKITVTPYYNGCAGITDTLSGIITVDSPASRIFYSILCSPHYRVQFSDSSYGDDSHLWIFGDGTTSTAKNPLHDYPPGSPYTVTLATYNIASGCRDTSNDIIYLTYPVLDFTATQTSICTYVEDTFTATVTGGAIALSYNWYFGGAPPLPPFHWRCCLPPSPPAVLSPTFSDTFDSRGIYNVWLVILDQNGCYDTLMKPNYLTVGLPVVNFKTAPATGCWPLTVTFTDASNDVPGVPFTKYAWAFGDGGTSTVTSASVSHTFTTTGTFTTEEIVTDNIGCKDSATLSLVTVWKAHVDFYATNQFPCVNDTAHFIDTNKATATSFWIFGDGGISTATSPSHVYTAAGTYTVTLAIVDIHGCRDTSKMVNYITVTKVTASFTQSDTFGICPPLVVSFVSTGTGATGYSWTFGDGNVSGSANPGDIYIKPGYYTVTMVDSNSHGCKDTATSHVNVYGYSGALSYSPLKGCSPLTVHFKAKISNVPSIIWDFSDGNTSAASFTDSINYTYLIPGAYVPKLILSDKTGCENSTVGTDTIKVDKAYAHFLAGPICINASESFRDSSHSYFSTISFLAWTFENGSVSGLNSPVRLYTVAGTFHVKLAVTDGWGCMDSVTEDVVVYPLPVITASPDTTICVTDAATLRGYGGVSYNWSPTGTVSCIGCNPTNASPTVVTTYTVTGTDVHSCSNTDTVTVFLQTKTVSHATGDTEVCRGAVVKLHDSGGTSYTWIPGAGLNNPTAAEPYADPSFTTKYMVVAKLAGCIGDTGYVWVNVHQIPTVDAGPDQRLVEGSPAHLQATGTLIETYSWGNPGTLSCDSCPNPIATISVTTTYVVNVASSFGCRNADTVTIHIYCDKSQIFMPNTFTPNGDGQNDVFYPRGIGVSDIKSFRIYNRWGQLLFERSDIKINDASNAWDGSYQGAAPRPDVYVWVLDAICETGEPINIKGDVTIIR